MESIAESLKVLGLGPNATPREIAEAYRNLAKVWHPDRFMDDAKLGHIAEEKFKEINLAFEHLRNQKFESTPVGRDQKPKEMATAEVQTNKDRRTASDTKKPCDVEYDLDFFKVFGVGVPWNLRLGLACLWAGAWVLPICIVIDKLWPKNNLAAIGWLALPLFLASLYLGYPSKDHSERTAANGNKSRCRMGAAGGGGQTALERSVRTKRHPRRILGKRDVEAE